MLSVFRSSVFSCFPLRLTASLPLCLASLRAFPWEGVGGRLAEFKGLPRVHAEQTETQQDGEDFVDRTEWNNLLE